MLTFCRRTQNTPLAVRLWRNRKSTYARSASRMSPAFMSFVSSSAIVESWGFPASMRTTDGMNEPMGSLACIFAAAFRLLYG